MTPSKCLPWEWATVRKTGQKRALSLRYPTRNWKTWKNSEKSWNQEKWQKHEKHEKHENQENAKSDKIKKQKKWKSDKIKKLKSVKNSEKKGGTRKRPKCQINGQKPHFVKSEPPGPAFFEFQGVPRDPVLRPKMTPPFLNVKTDAFLWFVHFMIYHFVHFRWFSFCTFCWFACEVTFLP